MVRRSRAESQEHNRAKVLVAARAEFTERGFRDAKIDQIAERAELTRGAVYSNFPGKQALYFAVLAEVAAESAEPPYPPTARTAEAALGDFARAWLARLPLATDEQRTPARLGRDLLPEILSGERTSARFAATLNKQSAVAFKPCKLGRDTNIRALDQIGLCSHRLDLSRL